MKMSDNDFTVQSYNEYFAPLLEKMDAFTPAEKKKAEAAFLFAARQHGDQKRASGEPYIMHPSSVAKILLEDYGMDCDTICAAFLHDVIEDCDVSRRQISDKFGVDVANLVDGVSKLTNIQYTSKDEKQSEDIRKMLLAMSQDIRVMLIKLADRLHNMRTLGFKHPDKQRATALETMEIYAPIAHRLGMHTLKNELEDIAIRCLDPIACEEIEQRIAMTTSEQTDFLGNIKREIEEKFVGTDIHFRVDVRVKSMCGIYRKVYIENRDIYDIFAVRIIVDTVNQCYMALGIIHDTFKPIADRFKDYISLPKNNGYRSIHTTVISHIGVPFEVQIRTFEMHQEAEYGVAAHWKYKIGMNDPDSKNARFEQRMTWLRQILEAKASASGEEDLRNAIKAELTNEDVFVFTPKGEVLVLPYGATIIDFAYAIHSAVGNKMTGAKVNGRIMPIDTQLTSGTVIEIMT
ncbi:MAG: bifunctional (p)ppGpp synthetase/guanosine-3',5'-bis(diphosphate) 3'-pyrophosphohydrolase, partial [Clostridia bacterium]|nr:bifunctional (p)ppGpp synthetase/guanosine-3',5'-bis(diphosphate) 3'-pyrophosphohydrolase [Clostridia bacterium]